MQIKCSPITTLKDQQAYDGILQYCLVNGLSMAGGRTAESAITIEVNDNGSEAYQRLYEHIKKVHTEHTKA